MRRRGMHIGFWWEGLKERTIRKPRRRWEDNIKMDLREIGWGGMDWIDLAQDRDQWRALVNTVMNLGIPQNSWVGERLAASQEGLSSMEILIYFF
jgi:hypothetical protein